jgi:hypothetical protein
MATSQPSVILLEHGALAPSGTRSRTSRVGRTLTSWCLVGSRLTSTSFSAHTESTCGPTVTKPLATTSTIYPTAKELDRWVAHRGKRSLRSYGRLRGTFGPSTHRDVVINCCDSATEAGSVASGRSHRSPARSSPRCVSTYDSTSASSVEPWINPFARIPPSVLAMAPSGRGAMMRVRSSATSSAAVAWPG